MDTYDNNNDYIIIIVSRIHLRFLYYNYNNYGIDGIANGVYTHDNNIQGVQKM